MRNSIKSIENYNTEEYKRSGVYCLTNKINGKRYVGQSINIYNRYRKHLVNSRLKDLKGLILYQAIRKYGEENFELSILEYGEKEDLDKLEYKYIKKYNTEVRQGNGYNMTTYIQPNTPYYKLNEDTLKNLMNDLRESKLPKKALENKYKINRQSINNINTGRAYFQAGISYPIRKESEEYIRRKLNKCFRKCKNKECRRYYQTGKKSTVKYCKEECYQNFRASKIPSKETLINLLKEDKSYTALGKELGVSGTMVRKYCKKYGIVRESVV